MPSNPGEIDLEELKRLLDAATADDEDQLSKRLISRGILRHDSIDHARRVLELTAEVERLNRLQSLATTRLAEYNADLQAAEAKLREIGREIIMISGSDAPSDELWIVINRILLKLARPS